jgi:hypothetical protein
MGHRVELHRRLHPIMGYRPDGSVHDHQPCTIRHRHEGTPSRHGLQHLGWGGRYRHRCTRIVLVGEPVNAPREISVALILAGIVGLKLTIS